MSSSTFVLGAVIRNPFSRETFTFSGSADDPQVARFDIALEPGGTGGANAIVHFHPKADERFAVRSGRLKVVVDGTENFIVQGEDIVVPRGRPHFFTNADGGTTEITVELRPAQQHVRFFANMASLAQNHPEWFSDQGFPHFLLAALMLHSYRDHLYGVVLPQPLPKLLFAAVAPLARMKGYKLAIEPRSRA
jgi:mannose-6-phosphate isomerase-like protein (cupin superfamily)